MGNPIQYLYDDRFEPVFERPDGEYDDRYDELDDESIDDLYDEYFKAG